MRKSKNTDNLPLPIRTNTALQETPDNFWLNEQFFGLTEPGDTLEARVTETYRQVVKHNKAGIKTSFTRYPSTGTIVATRVITNR